MENGFARSAGTPSDSIASGGAMRQCRKRQQFEPLLLPLRVEQAPGTSTWWSRLKCRRICAAAPQQLDETLFKIERLHFAQRRAGVRRAKLAWSSCHPRTTHVSPLPKSVLA